MTPTPQQTFSPTPGRATTVEDVHPEGAVHADRLWVALSHARAGNTPRTRAHSENAVYRFYLPIAHTLARSSARYPHAPDEVEQAAELGLAQAVLAWRLPTGRGFDRIATAAIIGHLQRAQNQTTRHLPGQDDRKSQQRTVAHQPVDE
jgi:hypothetical protein